MILELFLIFLLLIIIVSWTWSSTCSTTAAARKPVPKMSRTLAKALDDGSHVDRHVLTVMTPLPTLPKSLIVKRLDENPVLHLLRQMFHIPFQPFEVIILNASQPTWRDATILAQAIANPETTLIVTHLDPEDSPEWKQLIADEIVVWDTSNIFLDENNHSWVKAKFHPDKLNQCASFYLPGLLQVEGYEASVAREKELRQQYRRNRNFSVRTPSDAVEACIVKAMYPTTNVSTSEALNLDWAVAYLNANILL